MDWYPWQKELTNCKVILHYDESHQLYPISDWLHPGLIPIGNGEFDELFQDLANLEWFLRHLGWLGFCKVNISSLEKLRGLDRICKTISPDMNLEFVKDYWFRQILKTQEDIEHVIIVSGLYLTNSDLRHALLLHQQRGNEATLLAIRGLKFQVGLVSYNERDNTIIEFKEKPTDKSQLINSGLLILNIKSSIIQKILTEMNGIPVGKPRENKIADNGNPKNSVHDLIGLLINSGILKTIELTGTNGEPWFLDLSKIETWIKLDPQNFIANFSHLFNG